MCERANDSAARQLGAVISFLFFRLHRHPPILCRRSDSIMQATCIESVGSIGAASASYVDGSFGVDSSFDRNSEKVRRGRIPKAKLRKRKSNSPAKM